MVEKLDDQKSLACFRTIAQMVPENVIFEILSNIKETARDGKIKKSRGMLFVNIIQSYCEGHGIDLGFNAEAKIPSLTDHDGEQIDFSTPS